MPNIFHSIIKASVSKKQRRRKIKNRNPKLIAVTEPKETVNQRFLS